MLRALLLTCLFASPLAAEPVAFQTVTDWKPVYGRVEAKDRLPARARIGGTLVALNVVEGDRVAAGQELGRIVDDKLTFQIAAVQAQIEALQAQLANARTELQRGEDLLKRGVSTVQRLDALRTQVDVLTGQIAAQQAQARVLEQQEAEGRIIAPVAGRVLQVPQAVGAVILPGEAVVTIGGGGFFLRLAVPERHASLLQQGAALEVETPAGPANGTLARIYPLIENGRVLADVDLPGLSDAFVDARVVVKLPVGQRQALLVPSAAVLSRMGLDYLQLSDGERVVVPGQRHLVNGVEMVEILSGLQAGDEIGAQQ